MSDRTVTTRRTIQQIKHCVEEALSIVEKGEDRDCAIDDLKHARGLIDVALENLKNGWDKRPPK